MELPEALEYFKRHFFTPVSVEMYIVKFHVSIHFNLCTLQNMFAGRDEKGRHPFNIAMSNEGKAIREKLLAVLDKK